MLEGYRFVKNEIVAGPDGTYGDDVPFFRLADAMFIKAECLLRLGQDADVAASLITQVRQRAFDDFADAKRTAADLTGGSIYDYGHREWTSEGAKNFDPTSFVATYEGGDDIELGGLLDDLAWEFVGEHHRRQQAEQAHAVIQPGRDITRPEYRGGGDQREVNRESGAQAGRAGGFGHGRASVAGSAAAIRAPAARS